MEILNFILEEALILVPGLIFLGEAVKWTGWIPNKFLPLVLLVIGIPSTMALVGWDIAGAIQGVLITAAAVYSNQIYKQLQKDE